MSDDKRDILMGICLVVVLALGYLLGSITPASYYGDYGYKCKYDHTCHIGLTCVYDDHGHEPSNSRSICLDGRTMGINRPAQ